MSKANLPRLEECICQLSAALATRTGAPSGNDHAGLAFENLDAKEPKIAALAWCLFDARLLRGQLGNVPDGAHPVIVAEAGATKAVRDLHEAIRATAEHAPELEARVNAVRTALSRCRAQNGRECVHQIAARAEKLARYCRQLDAALTSMSSSEFASMPPNEGKRAFLDACIDRLSLAGFKWREIADFLPDDGSSAGRQRRYRDRYSRRNASERGGTTI